jgi:hypothetical protein
MGTFHLWKSFLSVELYTPRPEWSSFFWHCDWKKCVADAIAMFAMKEKKRERRAEKGAKKILSLIYRDKKRANEIHLLF